MYFSFCGNFISNSDHHLGNTDPSNVYKFVPTPHETLASTAKSSRLMLLREIVTVSSMNHMTPINRR